MKKPMKVILYAILAITLTSCSVLTAGTRQLIKPGDKIGSMTLEQGTQALQYYNIWSLCDSMPDNHQPAATTADCTVPQLSGMTIMIGWLAKESRFDPNWELITWDLKIDDHSIDLPAFESSDTIISEHGENNKLRTWYLNLMDLSPGPHTLQLTQSMKAAVDDGWKVYQPGAYKHVVHFTVQPKAVYPMLASTEEHGQHPYSSKKSGLDFLLYLPKEYALDPRQQWPLILYLHPAYLRGSSLDLLKEAPLPARLETEQDFPFIVISPLGEGGYDFWSKEEMIDPVLTLLEELQTQYRIDPNRIYLTGSDMGGNGVWALGLGHPEYFAALAPIAGYASYPFAVPQNICDLKNVPVWAFHGGRDEIVPLQVEQDLVDALVACGGDARLTESPHMKADVPYKVYEDPALYEWLLDQSLD